MNQNTEFQNEASDGATTTPGQSLGPFDLTCLGLNCVVGSGVFLTPGFIAKELGPAAPAAFVVAGLLCFAIALCFSEMAGVIRWPVVMARLGGPRK